MTKPKQRGPEHRTRPSKLCNEPPVGRDEGHGSSGYSVLNLSEDGSDPLLEALIEHHWPRPGT